MFPGNRLRMVRKAAGVTQAELADAVGISQSAISQIENGQTELTFGYARIFARKLSCKAADLMEDQDNPDRLDDEERALIARYRQATAGERETLMRVTEAVVPFRAPPSEQDHSAGN